MNHVLRPSCSSKFLPAKAGDGMFDRTVTVAGAIAFALVATVLPSPASAAGSEAGPTLSLRMPASTVFGANVNPYEVAACDVAGPYNCALAWTSSRAALQDTGDWFPGLFTDGMRGNAFQHASWNARMAVLIGRSDAQLFATAHEQPVSSSNPPGPNLENRKERMDLCNNHKGWDEPSTLEIVFVDQISAVSRLRTKARQLSEDPASVSGMRGSDTCDGASLVIILRDNNTWIN